MEMDLMNSEARLLVVEKMVTSEALKINFFSAFDWMRWQKPHGRQISE